MGRSSILLAIIRAKHCCERQTIHTKCCAQVVPASVAELLDAWAVVLTHRLRPLPVRLERSALREAAQPAERANLASLAARIAAFTRGVRALERCN